MTEKEMTALFEKLLETEYTDFIEALLELEKFRCLRDISGMRGKFQATVCGNRIVAKEV